MASSLYLTLIEVFSDLGVKELHLIESLNAAWTMVGLYSFLTSQTKEKKQFNDACW